MLTFKPHFTYCCLTSCCSNIIDMRNKHKEAFLQKHGVKLGFMSAFVKAACFALQDQPVVNAGMQWVRGREIRGKGRRG